MLALRAELSFSIYQIKVTAVGSAIASGLYLRGDHETENATCSKRCVNEIAVLKDFGGLWLVSNSSLWTIYDDKLYSILYSCLHCVF